MAAKVKILLAILAIISIISVTSCAGGATPTNTTTMPPATTVTSVPNGKNIYSYGDSLSGDPVYQTNGPGMMYISCQSCHGLDAHGGDVFLMMQVFQAPNITWKVLIGQHMDHPPYTAQTFKQAVTKGLDPAGTTLEYPMPIWTISDRDLNDLISFLQTLP